jgi:hypothetical protein
MVTQMNVMGALVPDPVTEAENSRQPPPIWRRLLTLVAIGKASVGGAGAALAIAGAFNLAAAITAQHWLKDIEKHYLDYFALGGGIIGAVGGIFSRVLLR